MCVCECVCVHVCICVCVCMWMWWLFRYAVTRAECKYCCCVVCPQFVIGEIDVSDSENFLASPNVFDVAIKHGFFSPDYSRCDRSSSSAYVHTYILTLQPTAPSRCPSFTSPKSTATTDTSVASLAPAEFGRETFF